MSLLLLLLLLFMLLLLLFRNIPLLDPFVSLMFPHAGSPQVVEQSFARPLRIESKLFQGFIL
jgi:hypothetical protein